MFANRPSVWYDTTGVANFPRSMVSNLRWNAAKDYLHAATLGRGVYRLPQASQALACINLQSQGQTCTSPTAPPVASACLLPTPTAAPTVAPAPTATNAPTAAPTSPPSVLTAVSVSLVVKVKKKRTKGRRVLMMVRLG